MPSNPVSLLALRAAAHDCDALVQPKGSAAAHIAFPAYPHWRRQLARAAACPRYDTLADALQGLDALRAAVETAHARKPLAGIQRLRKALDAIEAFIEQVELAGEEDEAPVDPVLDLPRGGPLYRLNSWLGLPVGHVAEIPRVGRLGRSRGQGQGQRARRTAA